MTSPGGEAGGLFHFRQDIDVALGEIQRSLEAFPGKIDPLSQRIQNALIFDAAFSSEGIDQFIQEVQAGVGRAVGLFEGAGPLINEAIASGINPERAFAAFNQQAIEEVNRLQRIFTEGLGKGLIPPGLTEQLNGLAAKVAEAFRGVGNGLPGSQGIEGAGGRTDLRLATEQLQTTTRALVDSLQKEVTAVENRINLERITEAAQRRYNEALAHQAQVAEEDAAGRKAALRQANDASREVASAQKQLAAATQAEAQASAARRGIAADSERQLADAAVRAAESAPRAPRVTPQQLIDESTPNPQNPIFRGGPTAEDPLAGRTVQISPNVFGRTEDANSRPQFFETKPASVGEGGDFFPPSAERVDPQVDPTRVANLERKFEEASTGTAKLTEQESRVGEAARILQQKEEQLAVQLGNTNRYYGLLNNEVLTLTRETSGPARGQLGATTVSTGEQAQAAFAAEIGRLQTTAIGLNAAMKKDTEALEREARQADLAAKLGDGRAQTLRGGNIRDLTNGKVFDNNGANEITNPIALRRLNAAAEPPKGILDSFLGGLSSKGFNSEGDDSPGLTGIAGTAGNLAKYGLVAKALQDVFAVVGQLKAGVLDESKALVNLDQALESTAASSVDYANASVLAANAGIAGADAINIGAVAVAAYGNEIKNNTDANRVFAESIKQVGIAAVITGLSTADAQKALIQSTQGFGLGSEGASRINNAGSNAARNFGGDRGEILKAVGAASGAADAVGVSPEQLANIASLIQARTQKPGTTVGESLVRLLARSGDPKFNQALSLAGVQNTGNFAQELPQLSQFFNSQTGPARAQFVKNLGGRGALGDIAPLLEQGQALPEATTKSLTNGGAAADDFARRISSLSGQITAIVANFKTLAEEIGKTGIFAPIGAFIAVLQPALEILNEFFKVFNEIPASIRVTGIALLEVVGAVKLLQAAAARGTTLRSVIGLGAAKVGLGGTPASGAEATNAVTTEADTAAKRSNTVATAANERAKQGGAAATQVETEAVRASTLATERAAAAQEELDLVIGQRVAALQRLGVLEGEELTLARAAIKENAAEVAAREAATAAIDAEAAALAALNAERAGSLGEGVAGGLGGKARLANLAGAPLPAELGLLGRAGVGVRGFLTSTAGFATVAIGAAIATKSLIDETNRLSESYKTQADAAATAAAANDAGSLDAAAGNISRAGAARAKGASGVFGTVEDALTQLGGGQGGRDANAQDKQIALQLTTEAQAIRDQQNAAASQGNAGAFNGRISNIEQLTAGLSKLDAAGASAAKEVQAIVDAFVGVSKISPAVASAAVSGKFNEFAGQAVSSVVGEGAANFETTGKIKIPFRVPGAGTPEFKVIDTQLTDPKAIADRRKAISDLTQKAVTDAGVSNASDLTESQKRALAEQIARLYVGDPAVRGKDVDKVRELIANLIDKQLGDLVNSIPQGDQNTSTAVQAELVKRAQTAGQQAGSLGGGDPVAAARATLTSLQETTRAANQSGTEQTTASLAAIADAKRALGDGLAAQGKAFNDLVASASPLDAALGLKLALQNANDKLTQDQTAGASAVTQAQDQAAINAASFARQTGSFADQNAVNLAARGGNLGNVTFGQDGSVTGGALDPRAVTQQALVKLTNARNNVVLARSQGATGANLANAVSAYVTAYNEYATGVVTDANAARDASVAIGDKVGEAYAKAADALALAGTLLAGSPQQAAAIRAANQLQADANILAVQTAVATSTQNTDPRDKVLAASDQLQLDNSTLAATPRGDAAAIAALTKKVAADRLALSQTQTDLGNAQREASTDPRDTVREASNAVLRARDTLNLQLAGTQGYADAQKALRVAQLAQARAVTELANDRRDAQADPASRVEQAAAKLADSVAILKLDKVNSDQYFKDLKAVNDAKVALADANLQAARDAQELKIDTTDPVAEANLAAKNARDKLAVDRARRAAPDVINADLLNVEKTGEAAQKAALDQQLSLHAQQFQLRQISLAQYLTFLRDQDTSLRSQLAATKKGSEGYQQLVDELNGVDQTIQSVNAQATGLFNLGNIKVPTVFQIRSSLGVDARKDPTIFAPITTGLSSLATPSALAARGLNAVHLALSAVATSATSAGLLATPSGGVGSIAQAGGTVNNVQINGVDFAKVVAYLGTILGPQANRGSTTPRRVR